MIIKNPIILKEARARMRGIKSYVPLSIYSILLSLIVYITFLVIYIIAAKWDFHLAYDKEYGRDLFIALSYIQIVLIFIISTAFNVGAITQEIEHKTYKFLKVTPLSSFDILIGKILSTIIYSLLLLVISLPIIFLTVILGGISYIEIIKTYIIILSYTIFISSFAFYTSTIYSKTTTAVAVFYFTLFLYLFLPLFFYYFLFLSPQNTLSLINPLFSLSVQFFFYDFIKIFNIKIPIWVGSVIINSFFTFYILSLSHEKIYNSEGYKIIFTRISFLILFLFLIFYLASSLQEFMWKGVQKYQYAIFSISIFALLIFAAQSFAIGELKTDEVNLNIKEFFKKLLNIKDVFKNKVSSSLIYIIILLILSEISLIIIAQLINFRIFSISTLTLILFTATLFWTVFLFLLNFLFKGKYLARSIFFFIFLFINLGIFIPGMPHFLIFEVEEVNLLGYFFLLLNPGLSILNLTNPNFWLLERIALNPYLNPYVFIPNSIILQLFLLLLFLGLIFFLQRRYEK